PFTVDSWRACFDRSDASGLFEGFVRHEVEAPRGAGVRWGDKSPAYIRHVPLLLEHFPDAQIIHIVRDVRDYCISINRAWGKDMRRAAFRWGQEVASAYRACSTAPHRCLHVRYEELLRAPHLQMQKICGFLGTPFYDAMTRLGRPAEEFGDAAGRAEIVQTNFNKFAGRLTPRQIEQIESLAFDTMHLLGLRPLYAARRRTMTSVEQQARRLKDGLQLLIRSHSRFGVAGALRFHASHRRFAD
ncbi:MAG: sulfotransferase family protein, partial [Steroidobacter sp.]